MRYFLDTEFSERGAGRTVELISLALVREDGVELYAVSNEFDPTECNDWVKQHVLPQLPPHDHQALGDGRYTWTSHDMIRRRIMKFLDYDEHPEFWAYYAAYDWVLFCQLFGSMSEFPDAYPTICYDLQQLAHHLGVREPLKTIVSMPDGEHDALCDARWNRHVYEVLMRKREILR